jgi:predicted PhzF superfamily epimerase YddE/YHI9
MLLARDLLVVLDTAQQVQRLAPDFAALAQADYFGVCVTARGNDCDFVSRFFAPRQGINEDPVTGSAHCTLAPYWQRQLRRDTLSARQLSARGGVLQCQLRDDRVLIGGSAHCYLRGEISLPDSVATLEN